MNNHELLIKKLDHEMDEFKHSYADMQPCQVDNDFYIIGFYEEFFDMLSSDFLDNRNVEELEWLSTKEKPLEYLYEKWESCDGSFSHNWDDMLDWVHLVYCEEKEAERLSTPVETPLCAPWCEFSLSRKECDDFVSTMVTTIRGMGIDEGSGYYGLKSFVVDNEQLNLYCEISKEQEDGNVYYTVYYAVEYDGGDTIFADWRHTEIMDIEELKNVVFEIASADYTESVKYYIEKENNSKSSLSDKIEQASYRAEEQSNKNQSADLSR